jgi:hypothetical protein
VHNNDTGKITQSLFKHVKVSFYISCHLHDLLRENAMDANMYLHFSIEHRLNKNKNRHLVFYKFPKMITVLFAYEEASKS